MVTLLILHRVHHFLLEYRCSVLDSKQRDNIHSLDLLVTPRDDIEEVDLASTTSPVSLWKTSWKPEVYHLTLFILYYHNTIIYDRNVIL